MTEIIPATPTEEQPPTTPSTVGGTPTMGPLLPGFPTSAPRLQTSAQHPPSLAFASTNASSVSSISSESSAGDGGSASAAGPVTPNATTSRFRISDFVHDVSPTPGAVAASRSAREGEVMKGRRLFEV